MPRRRPLIFVVPLLGAVLALGSAAAAPRSTSPTSPDLPVKCAPSDPSPDGRVFTEPRLSVGWLRLTDFECGIKALQATYPDFVQITTTGKSKGGHNVYDVLLTDEKVRTPKRNLLVVSSIHGDEIGAREGAARAMEDMLDPRFLGKEKWVEQVLDRYVIHFLFPNPDGWVKGDIAGSSGAGLSWTRENGSTRDLNRNFPVSGWIDPKNQTLKEPESQGILKRLKGKDWYLGTDNHGQLHDTYAAAGLQIVGQFDYQKSETLARFADGITRSMSAYPVLQQMGQAGTATNRDVGPYHWGTLYDMLGYSASGSLIDYYNTAASMDGYGFATELTLGKTVAGNMLTYDPLRNQVWVDSIRAINFEMFRQAVDIKKFTFPVGGKTAYVYDPAVVTSADGAGYERGAGEDIPQKPYRVTRMKFFTDLNKYANRKLTAVRVPDVLSGRTKLAGFDSVVLADNAMPERGSRAAWVAKLRQFVSGGGNLVVTDGAAPILVDLGLTPDVGMKPAYVGFVTFSDRTQPLNRGLRGVASQTFDTVPIGYTFSQVTAPNWTVPTAGWNSGGGVTAGTNGTGRTIYGEKPLGKGKVRFLGALLPQPTEEFNHPYGLQNYAVTYTGYTLLQNMLTHRR
ncbi:MAG TPA: M14 family zinc carboxypeptidase [Mycobacteriales bacterium]|nr:M14 family zinc carboxypeptidase [Mycobacteriales bacterium]